MGIDSAAPAAKTDYSAILAEYKTLQQTAYRSQGVTKSDIDDLKEKLDTFVTDDKQKAKLSTALDAMYKAVELKETKNQNSNTSWDQTAKDMKALLTELAPEGEEAEVYDPTTMSGVAGGSLPRLNNHLVVSSEGLDLDGVDQYLAEHPEAEPYAEMVKSASAKYKPSIPVVVLMRQIQAESSWNPNAVGPFGEKGLTQFTPAAWQEHGEGDYGTAPMDPQSAINAQAAMMSKKTAEHGGNLAYALEDYNGWERNKTYDYNVSKRCNPDYVSFVTGKPYDQRADSLG
jgi:hypothetical protein